MDNRGPIRNNKGAGRPHSRRRKLPPLRPNRLRDDAVELLPKTEAPLMPARGPSAPAHALLRLQVAFALAVGFLLLLVASHASAAGPQSVNYSRDIRPILSNTCYKCHGPDEKQRKAGLRLDTKQGAYAKLESGDVAIVPGSSAKSAVWQRLTATDPDVRMPPPDSGKTVTSEQIDLIKRW